MLHDEEANGQLVIALFITFCSWYSTFRECVRQSNTTLLHKVANDRFCLLLTVIAQSLIK